MLYLPAKFDTALRGLDTLGLLYNRMIPGHVTECQHRRHSSQPLDIGLKQGNSVFVTRMNNNFSATIKAVLSPSGSPEGRHRQSGQHNDQRTVNSKVTYRPVEHTEKPKAYRRNTAFNRRRPSLMDFGNTQTRTGSPFLGTVPKNQVPESKLLYETVSQQ